MSECDYKDYPHSGGGNDHGPAEVARRGYNICRKCADAMDAAERRTEEAYKAAQENAIDAAAYRRETLIGVMYKQFCEDRKTLGEEEAFRRALRDPLRLVEERQ